MGLSATEWTSIELIATDYSEENAARNDPERGRELTFFDGELMPRQEVYAIVTSRLEAAGIREAEVDHAANWMAYGEGVQGG